MKPVLISVLLAASLASCGKKVTSESTKVESTAIPAELKAVFVERIAEEASPIHLARTTVQPGDLIVLEGQIMGSHEPFVDGRAAFILGDRTKLTPCNERPDDECETPWDVCCDSKEAKREGTATIQIIGADGRVLKQGLDGMEGLEKLAKIVVKGEVAELSGPANLVVNAKAIQVTD